MKFEPKNLDYSLSPYTGLTREHWIEAGKYLLKGVFENIKDFNAPVIVPRKEHDVTYPHKSSGGNQLIIEQMAQRFEGLARTMLIAAPLIHINPEITIGGCKLKNYYKNQILKACTAMDKSSDTLSCVGHYDDLQRLTGNKDMFRAYQQTVETCALVICLDSCREEIWDTYNKEEKDTIADFLFSYGNRSTVPQNWRLFNMLDLAFLHKEGYEIDKALMREHGQAILAYYAGDGWYRDGHSFDYYSCWAFNVYAPIWNVWYGYENEPYLAGRYEENSNRLMETYPDFFDRDGFTNMWGRSNVYRNAATSPFDGNLMLKSPSVNPGLARRIASGSLLQFFTRDDFLWNGVPTMGFYGQFTPLVQGYSCAESVYWMGKAFLCLNLSENHPFWTEKENNGTWDKLKPGEVKETVLNGPALCFTNHNDNGETILRSGKIVKAKGDNHGIWNYGKLCYDTKYPWESTPNHCGNAKQLWRQLKDKPESSKHDDKKDIYVETQQYVLKDLSTGNIEKTNVTLWNKSKGGVLYRRQFFDYDLNRESTWIQALNLADFPVPMGIVRVDKLRLFGRTVELTLGSYGFPDNGTEVIRLNRDNGKAVILKGRDHTGKEKQMAMTIYDGWNDIDVVTSKGTNPDSLNSIVIYGKTERAQEYKYSPYVMVSQVITKESMEAFTDDEIFPVKEIVYEDKEGMGGYGDIRIALKNGIEKIINFDGMEGDLQM